MIPQRNLYNYKAVCVSIYDGDTITADVDLGMHVTMRMPIRLNRIDAPEIRGEMRPDGLLAQAFIRSKLRDGDEFMLITVKDKKEKYGRMLGEVYLSDGTNLNDLMVHEGHAVYRSY